MQWRIYIVKFWTRSPPPQAQNSFNFMQFLGIFWQNRMLAPPPPGSWRPHLGEILDPPLNVTTNRDNYLMRIGSPHRHKR